MKELPKCPSCDGDVTEIFAIKLDGTSNYYEYVCPVCGHRWKYYVGGVV